MNHALKAISDRAAIEAQKNKSDSDYIENGLIYCGECHTPKQCRINLSGEVETIVHCTCSCRAAQIAADESAWREQQEAQRIERLKTNGIQDKQIREWTFFNDDGSNQAMSDKAMRYYAKWEQMYKENVGLLFWGTVGNGKTFFAACIANALLENGVPVLMTSFAKIINAMSGFHIEDKNEYINDLTRYKLLIIDDLGAERQSEFAQEIVYNVIDARYKNGQPLIITTNMTLDEIRNPKNITCGRIYDRILEMCVPIHFDGESRRKTAFQNKIGRAKTLFEE